MAVGIMDFSGSALLMIAIVLGVIATVLTYLNSRKLSGEVFEKPFLYFTGGIFLVTFSLFDVTFLQYSLSDTAVSLIHDLSFIAGLGLMLVASMKITGFLQGMDKVASKLDKKKK